MNQKILIVFLLSTLIVLATAHSIALYFSLYFRYFWLDIPMHILGGIAIAFAILVLTHSSIKFPRRYAEFLPTLILVLIGGLLWEAYEIYIGIPLIMPGYAFDTLKDLTMDIVGGTLGYIIGHRLETL